jgi:hypothetical protein
LTFDYKGYELKFIQRTRCRDGSAHLFTFIYKFYSPITKYHYILRAEYHEEDVFAIKFYCKKDKTSKYKYNKIVNKGDIGNILITCITVIPLLLKIHPNASFGFAGARTIDNRSKKVEGYSNNQRFRTYSYVISSKIGTETFTHFEYEKVSSYLLLNNANSLSLEKEELISKMFSSTYTELSVD